jgi:hypothetical protein
LAKLKEIKRKLEKTSNETVRQMRIDNDDDLDKAKEELKLQLIKMRDLKDERSEKDFERQRAEIKT